MPSTWRSVQAGEPGGIESITPAASIAIGEGSVGGSAAAQGVVPAGS